MIDYFHYCNTRKDSDDEWSMQAIRGSDDEGDSQGEKRKQPPCRDPPHVKIPLRNFGEKSDVAAMELGEKEPPCRGHPSLEGFKEFQKIDKERCKVLREYVINNQGDFCETCGINMRFTDHLFASYEYEALVMSKGDCKICGSKKGKICDVYKHQRYHRENCLK
jgi:hypothetical protein